MESKWPNTIRKRILFTGFTLCVVLVTRPTSAIEIHADPEVIVQNGTTGILRCTFKSSEVVSSVTTVVWYFQSSHPDSQFYKSPYVIFYFTSGRGFPGPEEFKDRVQFIGDINKRDVSIQLSPTYFSDNGTFFCDVKNPPDVKGTQARTELRVVLEDKHTTTPPPTSTPAGSTSITLPPSLSPPPLSVLLPIGSVYVVVLLVLLVLLVRRCVHRKLEDGEDDITSSITYSVVKASNHQQPPVKETRERETDSAVIYSAVRTEDIIYGQTTIRTRRPRLERIRQADSLDRIKVILNDTNLTDINQLPET